MLACAECRKRFVHMMLEFQTDDWGRIVHRVDASACRAIMLRRGCGGLKHITVKSLWVQEVVREDSIEIERISRGEMHAHIFASPSSAEELVTMSRSFDWDNDTCRPVLDRAQILTSDVTWDEFLALLFVLCCLLPELAETSMNRNLIKWYVRCVSFWTD